MLKYFKTDFKRIFSRTDVKVFWIFSIVFILFTNFVAYSSLAGQSNLLSSSDEALGFTPSELLVIVAIQGVMATLPYISFLIASLVYVAEKTERGFLKAVECGISKKTIAISKFIQSLMLCIVYVVVIFGLHILLINFLYGLDGQSIKYIIDFIRSLAILALPIISILACVNLFALQIKSELTWSIFSVIYGAFLHSIVSKLGILFKSNTIQMISKFLPSAAINSAAHYSFINGIINIDVLDYKVHIVISLVFIIVFMSLSIFLNEKRDLD